MTKLEFFGLHPDQRRLLEVAEYKARTTNRSKMGIVYLSRTGGYYSDFHVRGKGTLSEQIVNGSFFENVEKVAAEKRRDFFDCIGIYGEQLDPDINDELQYMLTLRDEWHLPMYLMNKNKDVWRIEPNDECGRNLTLMTTVHPPHTRSYPPLEKKY